MSSELPPSQFSSYAPPPKTSQSAAPVLMIVLVAILAGGCLLSIPCLIAVLLPAVQAAREAARQQVSMNNLRQIGMALHAYHDTHLKFPPAFIADASGRPRTSWRTLILPFMEQRPLYEQYDFNVAWDDPRNEGVRRTPLPFYASPRSTVPRNGTNYVVVTSAIAPPAGAAPGVTTFPGGQAQAIGNIRDGTANTILVIEIRNSDIEWSEPRDIDFNSLSTDPQAPNSINVAGGILVLMGDGTVRRLDPQTSLETLRALLTANGMENISP